MARDEDPDLNVDLARWFKPEELEQCPRCGNRTLIPSQGPDRSIRICLDCGGIDVDERR